MVEDHGAPEARQLPRQPGPAAVESQKMAKEQAAQRDGSWTAQNEMRGVVE